MLSWEGWASARECALIQTGMRITSDGQQTWELELKDRELEVARKADGRPVVVSGALEVRKGIAIRERWIIVVRNLSAS